MFSTLFTLYHQFHYFRFLLHHEHITTLNNILREIFFEGYIEKSCLKSKQTKNLILMLLILWQFNNWMIKRKTFPKKLAEVFNAQGFHFLFLKFYFYFKICTCLWYIQVSAGAFGGQIPRSWDYRCCELLDVVAGNLNLGLLEELCMLLTAEASLQPCFGALFVRRCGSRAPEHTWEVRGKLWSLLSPSTCTWVSGI